jgi:hypothetical protein
LHAGAVDFSRGILERVTARLAAIELRDVEWRDWGTPLRVEATIALRRSRERWCSSMAQQVHRAVP